MKKVICLFCILTLFACTAKKAENPPLSKALSSIRENLDNYFTALTGLQKFNGVVLAFKNDSLLLKKAYNLNDDIASPSHVTVDCQFDIHSVAKLMTHYLIVKLQTEGVIEENQTIDTFYPDFPKGDLITIEMLLNHRSGLPRELLNFEGDEFDLTSDEIVALAQKQPLLFEPGEAIQYSNVGYEVLYNIISKAYNKPFAQCIMDEVFIPLKMTKSGAHFFTKNDRVQHLAKNHTLKDSAIVEVPNILKDEFKTARLYATVNDLNSFLQEVEREPYRSTLKDENEVIAKDGGSKGIRAQVYTDLANDFRFVLLANYDEMPFFKTIEDVVKILKSEPFSLPKELNRTSIELEREILERYVGSYSFADFDGLILSVEIEDDHLVVFQGNEKIADLKAETETVFFENPKAAESFEFVKNESGSYNALMGWKGITLEGIRQ